MTKKSSFAFTERVVLERTVWVKAESAIDAAWKLKHPNDREMIQLVSYGDWSRVKDPTYRREPEGDEE